MKKNSREIEVFKSNELIQKSRHNLSEVEQNIINYVLTLINPKEDAKKIDYVIDLADLMRTMGKNDSGKNYQEMKSAIQELADKSWWQTLENGDETLMRWIAKPTISKKSGKIKIELDRDLKPFLIGMSQDFTKFELYNVLALKSKYSIRLYEILKSQAMMGKRIYTCDEIKYLLNAQKKSWGNFKQDCLSVAKKQINEFTDITIDYRDNGRRGKTATKIAFVINYKDQNQRMAAYQKVQEELDKGIFNIESLDDDFKDFFKENSTDYKPPRKTKKSNGKRQPIIEEMPDYLKPDYQPKEVPNVDWVDVDATLAKLKDMQHQPSKVEDPAEEQPTIFEFFDESE